MNTDLSIFEKGIMYIAVFSSIIVILFILFLINCVIIPYLQKNKLISKTSFINNFTFSCY